MRKLLFATIAVTSLAGAVPAFAQGYPGTPAQSDRSAAAVYGENHGGWLTALLFGNSEKAPVTASQGPVQQPVAGNTNDHATN